MSRYLLACPCGQNVEVEASQAGGQVTCACGTTLDVPALRNLRHLPVADERKAADRQTGPDWNLRQGLLAALVIFTVAAAGTGVFFWLTTPTLPEFDPEVRSQQVEENLDELTPVEGWQMWIHYYRNLAREGFTPLVTVNHAMIEAQIQQSRLRQQVAFGVAGMGLLVTLLAALLLKSKPQRPSA